MSTYTDLKNRVKENITVGYAACDRTTLQKVKFHNEENEYWGAFSGGGDFNNSDFNECTISNSYLYSPVISDAVIINDDGKKTKLSVFCESVQKLSSSVSCALSVAPSFNTILSGESQHLLSALQLSDVVSVLIDVKNVFAQLSS